MNARNFLNLGFIQEYNLTEAQVKSLLRGEITIGCLSQEWIVRRLVEDAPFDDLVTLVGLDVLVSSWPRWRTWIHRVNRRKGLDFLTAYLRETQPEIYGAPRNG